MAGYFPVHRGDWAWNALLESVYNLEEVLQDFQRYRESDSDALEDAYYDGSARGALQLAKQLIEGCIEGK